MIAALLGLALAAPVDVERARVALERGDPEGALDHARVAVSEDPGDWRAQRMYAVALEAAGLGDRVDAELAPAAETWPEIEVVRAWHRAWRDEGRGSALVALAVASGEAREVAAVALARLALGRGHPDVAEELVADASLPEGLAAAIEAAVLRDDTREALARTRRFLAAHPDRADLLAPLFTGPGDGPLERARSRAIRAARDLGARPDPTAAYRARTLLVAAGRTDDAEAVVAHLAAMGETGVPARGGRSAAARRALVRGLTAGRDPSLPDGPWEEVRDIGIGLALALRDMGRIPEALAVWEALRERRDDAELAVAHARQVLRTRDRTRAVALAREAVAVASRARADDLDRSGVRAWTHELAMAHAVLAEALLAADRPEEALPSAVIASLLAPTAEHLTLRAEVQASLGEAEAAWTSLAVASALGGGGIALLEATYPGRGDWRTAAAAAARTWSAETGNPLPERDAGDLPAHPDRPVVGARFPRWSLRDDAGEVGSDTLAGRVHVLVFWASWCAPCRQELPELAAVSAGWRQDGLDVPVVAVSVDDRHGPYLRVLRSLDLGDLRAIRGPEVGGRLGITALPTIWVVDREGIARHFHQGYGPGTRERLDTEVRALAGPR